MSRTIATERLTSAPGLLRPMPSRYPQCAVPNYPYGPSPENLCHPNLVAVRRAAVNSLEPNPLYRRFPLDVRYAGLLFSAISFETAPSPPRSTQVQPRGSLR